MSLSITLEQCKRLFHHPVEYAARQLGVSRPTIARVMRQNGYPRWPFRKVQAALKRGNTDPGPSRPRTKSTPSPQRSTSAPQQTTSTAAPSSTRIQYVRRSERNLNNIGNTAPIYTEDLLDQDNDDDNHAVHDVDDIDDEDFVATEEEHIPVRNRKRVKADSSWFAPKVSKKIKRSSTNPNFVADETKKDRRVEKQSKKKKNKREFSETNNNPSSLSVQPTANKAGTARPERNLPHSSQLLTNQTLLLPLPSTETPRSDAINGDLLPIPIRIPATNSSPPITITITNRSKADDGKKKKKSSSSSLRPLPALPLPPISSQTTTVLEQSSAAKNNKSSSSSHPRLSPPPTSLAIEQPSVPVDMQDESVMIPGGAVPWMSISSVERSVLGIPTYGSDGHLHGIDANNELGFDDRGWPVL